MNTTLFRAASLAMMPLPHTSPDAKKTQVERSDTVIIIAANLLFLALNRYGGRNINTPNTHRHARIGVRLTQTYASVADEHNDTGINIYGTLANYRGSCNLT